MTQIQSIVPNLGIDEKVSRSAATSLVQIFADQLALNLKTYIFGFNVIGPRFAQTHALLCLQQEKLTCLSEATAGQIRQLGHRVPSVAEVMKMTQIAPQKTDFVDEDSLMKVLLQDHEAFIVFLSREREKIANLPELVIEDFLLDQLKAHRILAWGLRAQLERLEGNMSFAVPTGMTSQHTQPYGQTQQGMGTQLGSQYGSTGVGMGSQQPRPSQMGTPGMGIGTQQPFGQGQQPLGVGMGSQPTQYGSTGMATSGQYGRQSSSTGMGSDIGKSSSTMGQQSTGMEGYGTREQQAWGQPTGMERPNFGQSTSGMGQTSTGQGSTGQFGSSYSQQQPPSGIIKDESSSTSKKYT